MLYYNKYICKHLLHSMLLITFSLTSIVWLTQALRFIDFIVNQGVSISVFLTLTTLLVPALLLMILPPAMLCSVLFVYNKLRTDSELVVLQAAGLSRWRLALPALQVGVGVTVLAYAISLYLQPVTYQRFRDMQNFLRNNYASILLQEGVFSNPVEGLTVFIRERDSNDILHGILVHDNRIANAAVTMMADEGKLVETPQGPRFLLVDGNRQEIKDGRLSYLHFDRYTLDISLYSAANKARSLDPHEMTVPALFTYDETATEAENRRRVAEGHQRLLWPGYALCLTLVALAMVLTGEFNRRGQPRRIVAAVAASTLILFAAVGMRGLMALHPQLIFLAYLNLLAPITVALRALLDRPRALEAT